MAKNIHIFKMDIFCHFKNYHNIKKMASGQGKVSENTHWHQHEKNATKICLALLTGSSWFNKCTSKLNLVLSAICCLASLNPAVCTKEQLGTFCSNSLLRKHNFNLKYLNLMIRPDILETYILWRNHSKWPSSE